MTSLLEQVEFPSDLSCPLKKEVNQSKEYAIPMEVTNETIKDFNIDPSKVVWTKIGNKKVRAYMVPCTEEQYYEYMRPLWREDKNAQNREASKGVFALMRKRLIWSRRGRRGSANLHRYSTRETAVRSCVQNREMEDGGIHTIVLGIILLRLQKGNKYYQY